MHSRELVEYLIRAVIGIDFPSGRRLRIDDVPEALASRMTQALYESQREGELAKDIEIYVLKTGQASNGFFLNRDDMVNKRNRAEKLVMFVPEAEGVSEGSLDNSFQRASFKDILNGAIAESIIAAKTKHTDTQFSDLVRISSKSNVPQLEAWAFWSGFRSENIQDMGKELWRLNLIPDADPEYLQRIANNENCAEALLSRSKPLSPLHERITNASLSSGEFRAFLESELNPLPMNFREWLRTIAETKLEIASFHLWPIVLNSNSVLKQVSLAPFRNKDGEPTRACKLIMDAQGRLVAADSVVISWTVDPGTVTSLSYFEVKVLPVEELREDDTTPLYVKLVSSSARTHKVNFALDEDTELLPAYVVQVSAVTAESSPLICQDGSLAIVESEDFSIQGSADEYDLVRKSNASSIYEGVLDALINRDVNNLSLDAPSSHSGYFTIRLNNKRVIRIPSNPNLDSLTGQIIRDSNEAGRLVAKGLRSHSFSPDFFEKVPIPLPRELMKRRVKFFAILESQGSARMLPQFADWNLELIGACEEYVAAYFSAIRKAKEQDELSLLWLDCLHVSLDEGDGSGGYAISTPLHPLRLAWLLEFNKTSKSWVEALLAVESRARQRNFDLDLFSEITPRNLPWLAPGDSDGEPLVYQLEFSNNYGFYAYPSKGLVSRDLASLREFFQVDGGSQYELRDLPRSLAKRFNDFIQAQTPYSPFSVYAVNPGDGRAFADAFRLLGSKAFPAEMPKTRVLASGEMGVSARPIAELQSLSNEMEERNGPSEGPFHSQPLELRILHHNEIPEDEHVNISVIRNLSSMEFIQADESKLPPHLRGLINPLVSEFLPGSGETIVTAPAGRHKSKNDPIALIPSSHEAYIEALSRASGREGQSLGLRVRVGTSIAEAVSAIQSRSDWMMTIDDFMPIQSLEATLKERNADTVILDYSPDFIDGFGPRLSVSTSRIDQLESVVQSALEKLEISDEPFAAKRIVRDLGLLSGRLPLVIMKDNTEAIGAIGLAAAVRHLKVSGSLSKTVIIPLDSHLDLFREEPSRNQRCDLLLVKFTNTNYSLEFVEVKNYSKVNSSLLELMKNQIESSISRLDYLTQPGNSAVDLDLQWARWSGLLRFYASRSFAHGLLSYDDLEKLSAGISRMEFNHESPSSILKTGIVVNIPGDEKLPMKHGGMKVTQLSAVQFEQTILRTDFSELL